MSSQVIALDFLGFGECEKSLEKYAINYLSRFFDHFLRWMSNERLSSAVPQARTLRDRETFKELVSRFLERDPPESSTQRHLGR